MVDNSPAMRDTWIPSLGWEDPLEKAMIAIPFNRGFKGSTSGKEPTCQVGDAGLISESGQSPRGGHSNPLQYSCLENPMDGGDWQATVQRVTGLAVTE